MARSRGRKGRKRPREKRIRKLTPETPRRDGRDPLTRNIVVVHKELGEAKEVGEGLIGNLWKLSKGGEETRWKRRNGKQEETKKNCMPSFHGDVGEKIGLDWAPQRYEGSYARNFGNRGIREGDAGRREPGVTCN